MTITSFCGSLLSSGAQNSPSPSESVTTADNHMDDAANRLGHVEHYRNVSTYPFYCHSTENDKKEKKQKQKHKHFRLLCLLLARYNCCIVILVIKNFPIGNGKAVFRRVSRGLSPTIKTFERVNKYF